MTQQEAHAFLLRVHYNFFMTRPRFWYERESLAADTLICVAASNLLAEIRKNNL